MSTRSFYISFLWVVPFVLLLFTQCRTVCRDNAESWNYEETDDSCFENGKLSARKRLSFYPFNQAKEIKIISFDNERNPLDGDSLDTSKIKESITLNKDQINDLTQILYNFNYDKTKKSGIAYNSICYYPRHAIVFYDNKGKMFAYMEFCFECFKNEVSDEKVNIGEFCEGKYELISDFFKERGITYFNELENDIQLR